MDKKFYVAKVGIWGPEPQKAMELLKQIVTTQRIDYDPGTKYGKKYVYWRAEQKEDYVRSFLIETKKEMTLPTFNPDESSEGDIPIKQEELKEIIDCIWELHIFWKQKTLFFTCYKSYLGYTIPPGRVLNKLCRLWDHSLQKGAVMVLLECDLIVEGGIFFKKIMQLDRITEVIINLVLPNPLDPDLEEEMRKDGIIKKKTEARGDNIRIIEESNKPETTFQRELKAAVSGYGNAKVKGFKGEIKIEIDSRETPIKITIPEGVSKEKLIEKLKEELQKLSEHHGE